MRGFVPFGPDHRVVLLTVVAGALVLVTVARRLRTAADRRLRIALVTVLVSNELIAYGTSLAHGVVRLPLQLCDLAFLLTAWALVSLRPSVSEVAYFWGLAGSLQAILTPDLQAGFPDYWWIKFFISHCSVVLSVIYLAVSGRVTPTHRSVWRIFGWTNLYACIAGGLNWFLGTNLGYLARKPSQPSLLDSFGPWPYYILAMEAVALLSFYLYYLPFALARRFVRSAT